MSGSVRWERAFPSDTQLGSRFRGSGVAAWYDGCRSSTADVVNGGGVVVLSGAGISTESASPTTAVRRESAAAHPDDVPGLRRRAVRPAAVLGAQPPRLADDRPRPAERRASGGGGPAAPRLRSGVITQNVDGLHQAAGSDVMELHGSLDRVVCLACGPTSAREARPAAGGGEPGLRAGGRPDQPGR